MTALYGIAEKITRPLVAPAEITELAEAVRSHHHADRLEGARIAYMLGPGKIAGGKRTKLGKARLCPPDVALLSGFDFIITLHWAAWQRLTEEQRLALLDHELMHCDAKTDDEGEIVGWRIREHDFEGFVDEVDRHGLWTTDLLVLAPVAAKRYADRQSKLPFMEADAQPEPEPKPAEA